VTFPDDIFTEPEPGPTRWPTSARCGRMSGTWSGTVGTDSYPNTLGTADDR
jgi:hypothetical protein